MSFETVATWFGVATGVVGLVAAILQFGAEKLLKMTALLCIAVLCIVCGWYVVKHKFMANSTDNSPPIEIASLKIIEDVAANPELAKRAYGNKKIQITGEVERTENGHRDKDGRYAYTVIIFGKRDNGTAIINCKSSEQSWMETSSHISGELQKKTGPIFVTILGSFKSEITRETDLILPLNLPGETRPPIGSGKSYMTATIADCIFVVAPKPKPVVAASLAATVDPVNPTYDRATGIVAVDNPPPDGWTLSVYWKSLTLPPEGSVGGRNYGQAKTAFIGAKDATDVLVRFNTWDGTKVSSVLSAKPR